MVCIDLVAFIIEGQKYRSMFGEKLDMITDALHELIYETDVVKNGNPKFLVACSWQDIQTLVPMDAEESSRGSDISAIDEDPASSGDNDHNERDEIDTRTKFGFDLSPSLVAEQRKLPL